MRSDWRKAVFYVAGAYDVLLGAAFFVLGSWIFRAFDVTPPNHQGYVQFPALLLIIFGFLFLRIARNPLAHRDLIPYGIALKAAYSGLVFWYQFTEGIPWMWVPWAWVDLVFLILFVVASRGRSEVR